MVHAWLPAGQADTLGTEMTRLQGQLEEQAQALERSGTQAAALEGDLAGLRGELE